VGLHGRHRIPAHGGRGACGPRDGRYGFDEAGG
jgi:hypothetical protein